MLNSGAIGKLLNIPLTLAFLTYIRFNDFICNRYIRTHGGKYKPENRLWGVYPAWVIGIAGLILFGETLQRKLSWVGIAFGWGMNCFSTLGTTVAVSIAKS